ncbi:MAG TPA: hypothetical protein VK699_14915 [Terriglobales bacterium]|nr:hypothetical protein [Terriglobales bacterium]
MFPIDNSDVITRYLLGDVSEEERAWVEARMISDEGFIDECFQAEDKVIDDYVAGHLAARERGLFETNFLRSPRRQAKLQTAKFLVDYARDQAQVQSAAEARERSRLPNMLASIWRLGTGPSRMWPAAAVVSALILGITALAAVAWSIHGYRVAERAQRQSDDRLQQLAKLEKALDDLQKKQLQESQASANQDQQVSGRANKPLPQTQSIGPVATLVLPPGGFREQGEVVKEVVLPPETPLLQLKLMVEPGLKYSRYRVTLQHADGETVITANNLPMTPTKTVQGEFITVALPSQLLSSGDYVLVLAGQPDSRKEYQSIASYNLRIEKTR